MFDTIPDDNNMPFDTMYSLWSKLGIFELMHNVYREQIENNFYWDTIKSELESCEYIENEYELEKGYDDYPISTIYIGSVFSVMPSGKYWTFFACGNMYPDEMLKDEIFMEVLEDTLSNKGMFISGSDSDACDMFFGMEVIKDCEKCGSVMSFSVDENEFICDICE